MGDRQPLPTGQVCWSPRPSSSRAPAAKPITVPLSARQRGGTGGRRRWCAVPTRCRVPPRVRAGHRSWSATRTAAASASDPRRLLRKPDRTHAGRALAMTRITSDSAAARRSAVVACGPGLRTSRGRRAAMVPESARLVAINASPDHGTDGDGDRLGVNGAPLAVTSTESWVAALGPSDRWHVDAGLAPPAPSRRHRAMPWSRPWPASRSPVCLSSAAIAANSSRSHAGARSRLR